MPLPSCCSFSDASSELLACSAFSAFVLALSGALRLGISAMRLYLVAELASSCLQRRRKGRAAQQSQQITRETARAETDRQPCCLLVG